jgi:hypothetical protein
MAAQYRHFIPENPDSLVCNHRMFYVNPKGLSHDEAGVLAAMLNSTLVAFFKTFYGRYTGTEGSLDTEVLDVNLMEVPDVRGVSQEIAARILAAFALIQARPTQPLVEHDFMHCHTVEHVKQLSQRPVALCDELRQEDRRALDDGVLEMIGVADPRERARLLDELYLETARHYRQIRIMEVQKQVQRAGGQRRLTSQDIAASIWDSLAEDDKGPPLADWLKTLAGNPQAIHIPDGKATALGKGHMFAPADVEFAQGKTIHHETYAHPVQAALVAQLANLEVRGQVELPADERACAEWRKAIEKRLADARTRFDALAGSRTGTQTLRDAAAGLLMQWFLHGRR